MTLIEILSVRKLKRQIKSQRQKIKSLQESLTQTTIKLTGMPRSPNRISIIDKVSAELMDAKESFAALEEKLKLESKNLAAKIESSFSSVIEEYYFECQTLIYRYAYDYNFRKIAQSIRFSVQSVYRFHSVGLAYLGFKEDEILYLQAV